MTNETGWIEWGGGECPVHGKDRVIVKCKFEHLWDEFSTGSDYPMPAKSFRWQHCGLGGDIMKYKVIEKFSADAE